MLRVPCPERDEEGRMCVCGESEEGGKEGGQRQGVKGIYIYVYIGFIRTKWAPSNTIGVLRDRLDRVDT